MSTSSSVRAASRSSTVRHPTLVRALEKTRNGRATPSRSAAQDTQPRAKQRAYIVAALPAADDLSALRELVRSPAAATLGHMGQHREQPHPNIYIGPGKVPELKELNADADANEVVTAA